MGTGKKKLEIAFVEDSKKRDNHYRKRLEGILKKVKELAVLCGADIFLYIKYKGKETRYNSQEIGGSAEVSTTPGCEYKGKETRYNSQEIGGSAEVSTTPGCDEFWVLPNGVLVAQFPQMVDDVNPMVDDVTPIEQTSIADDLGEKDILDFQELDIFAIDVAVNEFNSTGPFYHPI
uniref:MADS-box domain-containing protein n=1 Tax=Picea sitchensis TaxID=3332 RepID=D5ACD6_PICSI|nr:unknown [Picea sitchensis]